MLVVAVICADFEQGERGFVFANEDVAQGFGQAGDEGVRLEAFSQDLVKNIEHGGHILGQQRVSYLKIIVVIEDVEVFDYVVVSDFFSRKTRDAVEYRKGIAEGAVGFFGLCLLQICLTVHVCYVHETCQQFHQQNEQSHK